MRRPPLRKANSLGLRKHASGEYILSRELEEWLFSHMEVMFEGSSSAGRYFGSSMWSIPLDSLRKRWRGTFDEESGDRLIRAIEGSVRFKLRLMRHALSHALTRLDGSLFDDVRTNISAHQRVGTIDIDVDIEVVLLRTQVAES